MDEKASLQDKVQDLEHLTDQLAFETETIGNTVLILLFCDVSNHVLNDKKNLDGNLPNIMCFSYCFVNQRRSPFLFSYASLFLEGKGSKIKVN